MKKLILPALALLISGSAWAITVNPASMVTADSDATALTIPYRDASGNFNTVDVTMVDLTATGNVSLDGGTFVYNDTGADLDARFEGSGEPNALVIQGSDGFVGVGTSAPGNQVEIDSLTGVDSVLEINTTDSDDATSDACLFLSEAGTTKWSTCNDGSATDLYAISSDGGLGTEDRLVIEQTGDVGIGTTDPDAPLEVESRVTPTAFILHVSSTDASNIYGILGNGHVSTDGGTPAVTSCGTSPTIAGNDVAGKITIGSSASSTCTATFALAYAVAPACTFTNGTVDVPIFATTTTTAMVLVDGAADFSSDVIMYRCTEGN